MWGANIIRKKIIKPPNPKNPKPSVIKGPNSFGPQDGELFLKLGREKELSHLLNYVLE